MVRKFVASILSQIQLLRQSKNTSAYWLGRWHQWQQARQKAKANCKS